MKKIIYIINKTEKERKEWGKQQTKKDDAGDMTRKEIYNNLMKTKKNWKMNKNRKWLADNI